ncbi:DUF4197 domain-containing protein [Parvularcula sp. ZS-1/3]|uniref:DUF4197 domain-containing protein n=1 Tax=Parvularcula mediterranea TaxID=2732508 RepID=A0A7Y3W492_9PROT|nr:DUF4197 domain-containing protein [Parvularcula mediterranea]NNU15279.1 DUF4197 domain-containing protein [Parvularcula mediterranea]
MSTFSRRSVLTLLAASPLAACNSEDLGNVLDGVLSGSAQGGLTSAEAAEGIKAALTQGIGEAIGQVGKLNGYFADGAIRIPLPGDLREIQEELARFGLSGSLDDLERQLNRGAEQAAPQARGIFLDAIRSMSIRDAIDIVRGSDTAATDYFRGKTSAGLTAVFSPIMTDALQRVGAIQTFDRLVSRLAIVPGAPELGANAKQDLINHGVDKGLGGLFYYVAQEEKAIRENPAKRTTEILRRVFG